MSRVWSLYRFYDAAGVLLYVGLTAKWAGRWVQHAAYREWWPRVATVRLVHFTDEVEGLAAEADVIRQERPLFNLEHNGLPKSPPKPHRTHGSGSLFQRHDGRWTASVTENGTRRQLYSGREKAKAEAALAAATGSPADTI